MRFTIPIPRPSRFLACYAAFALLVGNSRAATLYGLATGDSLESKWTTGVDLGYSDGSVGFVSRSLPRTDPAAAAAYVTSMPESSGRDSIIGIYLLSVSMGGYESNNESHTQAIESALIFGGSGVIDAGRGRGRTTLALGTSSETLSTATLLLNGDSNRTLPPLSGNLGGLGEETNWSIVASSGMSVPEPSAALLGVLGGLGLLRRRRAS